MAMKVARLLGVLAALVILVGCNDDALPPGGTYSTVQGVVLDHATNQPIADAQITIDTVLHTKTDSAGKFTLNVPSGDFDYTIEAQGYKPVSDHDRADPQKTITLNILLNH